MTLPSSVCSLVAALAVVVLALQAHRRDRDTDTFVLGCDTFGYERMARVVRDARAAGTRPDFSIHDAQTRWLVDQFKAHGQPVPTWDESVTTHAHHYFPGSDQVGPQYPPGTARVLSIFPEGNDVKALDRWTIGLVAAGGLALAAWCAWRGLAASGLVLAGSVATLLAPFGWIRAGSYSINATILPLFAGTLLAWAAARVRGRRAAVALALGAGALFGLLIQVRLASALLAPAAALLFVPRRWRLGFPFGAGVLLAGVGPVLLHNRAVTGSLLGATYNGGDRTQALDCVSDNLRFYFGRYAHESGWLHVLGLVVVVGLWLALAAVLRPRGARPAWGGWLAGHWGLAAAPVVAAGLSVAYFLTHAVTISYYLTPAGLLTGLLLGLGFVALEEHWRRATGDFVAAGRLPAGLALAAVAVAIPVAALNHRALGHLARAALERRDDPPHVLAAPPALLEPGAWVWADLYSSSILFYTGHPAFKISFATPETRRLMYGWIKAKGDPQYLVDDSAQTRPLVAEARAAGWRLVPVGEVRDATCYRMDPP